MAWLRSPPWPSPSRQQKPNLAASVGPHDSPGSEAFISLDPDGDVAPVGRAIDDQQLNPEQVAEVDELVDLGRVDNTVCCKSPR